MHNCFFYNLLQNMFTQKLIRYKGQKVEILRVCASFLCPFILTRKKAINQKLKNDLTTIVLQLKFISFFFLA